ncbi:polysaccharide biosynthesis/export family protein [Calothrix sp. UHCC 0171]|uniref:polysaccharide biosynthesis/export family protein n=1 Tax=Calothrix sp. UHCC 0171 TaxID=3110245 RepID=UPI002B21066D|nr:polysaccharide biosynthesis/export family protein [Calothrix sp. UHCC 0171]MEA5569859.1 polysaccharide biosynthesis/export family protein [Calothrix sp. UHCC 0171]
MAQIWNMLAFRAFCFASLQAGVFFATLAQPAFAQNNQLSQVPPPGQPIPVLPEETESPLQPASPPSNIESTPLDFNDGISPQFNRYYLGVGDSINILVQRPPGRFRLGQGDAISVIVQRFPDLSFQAQINPEGNIVVPLLGTVQLQNLSLQEAQERIRIAYNQYVVNPVVALSLTNQRPDQNFQSQVNPEGNITVPLLGTVSVKGLTLEEAQEKVRLGLSKILVDPVVTVSLFSPRPVQITVSGEVFRPGIYPATSSIPRVTDALLSAGGSTMMADLRQVQVRRRLVDGTVISQNLNLYASLQNGGSLPNLRLQDGDAIVIPRREVGTDDGYDRNLIARSSLAVPQIRIRILNYAAGGLVTQALPNGSSFVDAIAGINPENSNLRDIALIRFDPERGKAVTQRIDAKRALQGDVTQNVPLQDNDVIVVGRNLLGKITNVLSTITRPFFDVQSFIRFFETLGGGRSN